MSDSVLPTGRDKDEQEMHPQGRNKPHKVWLSKTIEVIKNHKDHRGKRVTLRREIKEIMEKGACELGLGGGGGFSWKKGIFYVEGR